MFANKLGNLHSTPLCAELRLWWLGFLLYHRLLWLFQGRPLAQSACVTSR